MWQSTQRVTHVFAFLCSETKSLIIGDGATFAVVRHVHVTGSLRRGADGEAWREAHVHERQHHRPTAVVPKRARREVEPHSCKMCRASWYVHARRGHEKMKANSWAPPSNMCYTCKIFSFFPRVFSKKRSHYPTPKHDPPSPSPKKKRTMMRNICRQTNTLLTRRCDGHQMDVDRFCLGNGCDVDNRLEVGLVDGPEMTKTSELCAHIQTCPEPRSCFENERHCVPISTWRSRRCSAWWCAGIWQPLGSCFCRRRPSHTPGSCPSPSECRQYDENRPH